MNQTQKRLSIIKLAISIGDKETIQLQMLKLAPLKTDRKIQEILHGLQAENYAQTLPLITEYIETPPETILQRTIQDEIQTPEEDEAIIEEFDLFRIPVKETPKQANEIVNIEAFEDNTDTLDIPLPEKEEKIDYDSLLNLQSDDILQDNIYIQQTRLAEGEDDFFENRNETENFNYTEVIEKDDFFHNESAFPDPLPEESDDTQTDDKVESEHADFENPTVPESVVPDGEHSKAEPIENQETSDAVTYYDPLPYIDQKFKNMLTQYPPVELPSRSYDSVNTWLQKIAAEGYTEAEIEALIETIMQRSKEGEKAEAAQLLLIAAATHSPYAQFILARALFKGDILEQNLPEAFTLINRMAMDDDYPEAICDLAQLYEHGIGVEADEERAQALYKEAMERGIKRAKAHYERLSKANKGFLGKLFGK